MNVRKDKYEPWTRDELSWSTGPLYDTHSQSAVLRYFCGVLQRRVNRVFKALERKLATQFPSRRFAGPTGKRESERLRSGEETANSGCCWRIVQADKTVLPLVLATARRTRARPGAGASPPPGHS